MGVHFVNDDLVGDGKVDATKSEALMYEMRSGRMQLVDVEHVMFWNARVTCEECANRASAQTSSTHGSNH